MYAFETLDFIELISSFKYYVHEKNLILDPPSPLHTQKCMEEDFEIYKAYLCFCLNHQMGFLTLEQSHGVKNNFITKFLVFFLHLITFITTSFITNYLLILKRIKEKKNYHDPRNNHSSDNNKFSENTIYEI